MHTIRIPVILFGIMAFSLFSLPIAFAQTIEPSEPSPTPIYEYATIPFMGVKLGQLKEPFQDLGFWLNVILKIILPAAPPSSSSSPTTTPAANVVTPTPTPDGGSSPTAPPGAPAANLPEYPPVSAANCTITYSGPIDGKKSSIAPGSVICVPGNKTYSSLSIDNISGTKNQPITIVNKGGQVKISGGGGFGIDMNNAKFFHFTGTGDSSVQYGFLVDGGFSQGARIDEGSTDYKFDHVEVRNVGIGLGFKTKTSCDGTYTAQNFKQLNTVITENYVHDTSSEAMYIGANQTVYASSGQGSAKCPAGSPVGTDPLQPVLEGLWVFQNKVERFGKDGINVKGTPKQCFIYNNTIRNGSTNHDPSQEGGINSTLNTSCEVYNNTITDQWGSGIKDQGKGGNSIHDNTLTNIQDVAISIGNSTPGATTVTIQGNTIQNAGTDYKLAGRGVVQ